MSVAVLGFGFWLVFHALLLAPVFKPEAVFAAWFLVTPFLVAGRLTCVERSSVAKAVVGLVTLLALWGGTQHWLDLATVNPEAGRAHAWFESPNTLAAVINLALIPVVVGYLLRGGRLTLLTAAVLFLGLLATQSRGGWLGFGVGLIACAVLFRRSGLALNPVAKRMLVVVFAGALVLAVLPHNLAHVSESNSERLIAGLLHGDTARRTDLYEIAWDQISKAPWVGQGYLSFRPLYRRSGQDLFRGQGTLFVHNDYLQTWLEMGLLRIVGLLGAVATAGVSIWRATVPARSQSTGVGIMLGGGLATVAAHALVDFPFYAPIVLVLVGLALGVLPRLADDAVKTLDLPISWTVGPVRIHVIVAACLSIWLLLPAAAHTTAGLGLKALSRGDVNRALDLYTWAKTAAPYNPYYYWTLGVIWKDQAIARNDQSAAVRADGLFAEGFAIDPNFDLNPKQRIKLNRDHPALLPDPLTGESLVGLAATVRDIWPRSVEGQVEYARTLHRVGDSREALRAYQKLAQDHPDSTLVKRLAVELSIDQPGDS